MILKVLQNSQQNTHDKVFKVTVAKINTKANFNTNPQFPKKKIIYFNESSLKMMKNAFILKALFVHKIFKILSWLFSNVEKEAWLET